MGSQTPQSAPTVAVLDGHQGELIGELDDDEQQLVLRKRAADVFYELGQDGPGIDPVRIAKRIHEATDVDARVQYRLASSVMGLVRVVEAACCSGGTGAISEDRIDAIERAVHSVRKAAPNAD